MDAEDRALARMRDAGDAMVAGVERDVPAWVVDAVRRILDAWNRVDPTTRRDAEAAAVLAGEGAARRVAGLLRELLALDPSHQSATPLEVVRTVYREPTAVLEASGVPPVERDPFEERAWPDDRYGLVPRRFADLAVGGEEDDLGPLHLAWGMAKASVLRARTEAADRRRQEPDSRSVHRRRWL